LDKAHWCNLWEIQIFSFCNLSGVSSTFKVMRFHENQRDPAGSNGSLSSIYDNLKNMEERMEDKCYKYVERSHSGFTNEPYVST